jgi:uncharacterized membrane protein YtjA (UPF0391 family)
MLQWVMIFLAVALVSAIFGFGGFASVSAGIAQILAILFVVLAGATLVLRGIRDRD